MVIRRWETFDILARHDKLKAYTDKLKAYTDKLKFDNVLKKKNNTPYNSG